MRTRTKSRLAWQRPASVPEAAPLNTELEDLHPSAAGQLPELQDSDSGYCDVLVPGH